MSGSVEYRVYLDNEPADRELYKQIETITINQAMDMATEARIELRMCANDKGVWDGPTDDHATPWRRVRVEIRNLTKEWVALIDGPIVAWNADMSSEPGQSTLTLVVNDDSVYLNLAVKVHKYEGKTDDEIVKDLLTKGLDFDKPDVDPFKARPKDHKLKIMRFCTPIDLLLELARPWCKNVYVRPGPTRGKSIGCVKDFVPKGKPKLPALVLAGPERNIDSFHARSDATQGAQFVGARLDIEKVATATYSSQWTDVNLIGPADPFADIEEPEKTEPVDPLDAAIYDVAELTRAGMEKTSFGIFGQGSVRAGCYAGVLTAYDQVGVSGVNQKLCTNWLIQSVTHTLGRSEYRQDFTLITNAVARVGRDVASMLPGLF